MKLCFIANPNTTHTRRWLAYFAERAHDVHLIAEHQPETAFPDVAVHDLTTTTNTRKLRYLIWSKTVRRLVRDLQPDVLHAHQITSAGWLAWAANYHPLVVTPWGTDLYQHPQRSPLARWLARRVLSVADLVTADSVDLLNQAVGLGADPNRSQIIQWGVDLSFFSPTDDLFALRRRLNLGKGPIILSPRSMRPLYRHDVTLEAIPLVCQAIPGVTFVFRDYNPDPPDYAAQLKERAQSLGVSDAVQFIGPTARYEDVADSYRAADLVISVPISDGTPVSVLEAFACGVPVIASDLPSLREWIAAEQSGLLVPVGDSEALAQAIIRLLNDRTLYARIRTQALQIVKERADHSRWMARMDDLYRELTE
jgi:glycosyltransferase involved in cell wall biosynthesis